MAQALAQIGELDHLMYTSASGGRVTAVRHAAPRIRAGGSVVLTSGTVAVRPSAGAALMAGGAAPIEGLTRGLAVELAPVRVNAVRPGAVHTPRTSPPATPPQSPAHPQQRRLGRTP